MRPIKIILACTSIIAAMSFGLTPAIAAEGDALTEVYAALDKVEQLRQAEPENIVFLQLENSLFKAAKNLKAPAEEKKSKKFLSIINTQKGRAWCHDGNDPDAKFSTITNILNAIDHSKEVVTNKCKDHFGYQSERCAVDQITMSFKPSYTGDCTITAAIAY